MISPTFCDKLGRVFRVKRLAPRHFYSIKSFYKRGIKGLLDKSFFLNFTDKELKEVLGNKGAFFAGAYRGLRLVGLSALDADADYGQKLRSFFNAESAENLDPTLPANPNLSLCPSNPVSSCNPLSPSFHIDPTLPVYEYSGVFVDAEFRRCGIADGIMKIIIDYAKNNLVPCYLCGVVQRGNTPSKNNFLSHGFVYVGDRKQDETYHFEYFALALTK